MPTEPAWHVVFAGSIFEADVVRNLLEGAGIPSYLKDEMLGTLAPWYAASGGAGAVKVVVREADLPRAHEIVERFVRDQADAEG